MPEADLGKIVGMIMENPELIEKIKELSDGARNDEKIDTPADIPKSTPSFAPTERGSQRTELLRALGGFLSDDRRRALESMSTVLGILDSMKTK